jgi:hypothetical protein
MDSPTGFDHDDFFGSYDAERAHGMSVTPLEFDDLSDHPPSNEQLAHWGRFRKPVGIIVAAMTLLSLVALGKGTSHEEVSDRPLVAHYGAALAAATPSVRSASSEEATLQVAQSAAPEASTLLPEELSNLLAEVWSTFEPPAPSIASTTVPLLVTDETDAAPDQPAADSALAGDLNQADSNQAPAFNLAVAPICLLSASNGAPAALDSSRIRGQAPESWPLPPSMTSSTPSVRR